MDAAATELDRRFMRSAISLAARGLGNVWPNPSVGCVIVKGGVVLGRGWTQPGGRPHAEQRALDQAGDAARGATVYVSLEPCAHHGKTPPCADALIAAGIRRVVSALTDPDPRVAGQGHSRLRSAGVEVSVGCEAEAARSSNAGFLTRVESGRPLLTLKQALTLDARIATATGESRWITGPQARRAVHLMRANHDAVLVGAGTARADDPDLRVRDIGVAHQPVRIVADSRLGLSLDSRLGRSLDEAPLWLLHGPQADEGDCAEWMARGARLFSCKADDMGRIDIADAMQQLGAAGLTRVLCEGGGGLAASLARADQIDRLAIFSAGHLFGADGTPGLAGIGVTGIEPHRWKFMHARSVGDDLFHFWQRSGYPPEI